MTTTTTETVFARCSFCGKPNTDVARLVAGPGVYICDRCVALCNDVLVASLSDGPPPPRLVKALRDARAMLEQSLSRGPSPTPRLPEWRELSDEQMLEHVPRIAATADQIEASLRTWIGELRQRGVTWARIGEALGMTRQSAWERFSGEE